MPLRINNQVNSNVQQVSNEPPQQSDTSSVQNVLDTDVLERFNVASSFADMLAQVDGTIPEINPNPLVPPTPESSEAQPAAQPEGGLGQKLEEMVEKQIPNQFNKQTSTKPWTDKGGESSSVTYGDQKMPDNLASLGSKGGTTIVEGRETAFEFWKIDEKSEGDLGTVWAKGSTVAGDLSGKVYYDLGADWDKKKISVGIGAQGGMEILGHHYEFGYKSPGITIGDDSEINFNSKVNADAYIGAKGYAEVGISLGSDTHVEAGAGGFEGASASLGAGLGVGDYAGAGGNLKAWAGIGAKAGFEAGFKDGEFKADFGLGLALGAGLEWDLSLKVNYGEIIDLFLDSMREIGLGEEAEWIENTAGDVIQGAGDAANWIGGAAEDAANAIGEGAEDVVDTAGDIIEGAADVGGDVVDAIGDVFSW